MIVIYSAVVCARLLNGFPVVGWGDRVLRDGGTGRTRGGQRMGGPDLGETGPEAHPGSRAERYPLELVTFGFLLLCKALLVNTTICFKRQGRSGTRIG